MTKTTLSIVRGDTTQFTLSASLDNLAVDLTGAKVWMTARRQYASTTTVFSKDSAGNGIVIDPDQVTNKGIAAITLLSSDTSSLPPEVVSLVFDIQCKLASGALFTAVLGTISIEPDVTVVTS